MEEDFTLKKIRYFQGSVKDFKEYWEKKIADGLSKESAETKSLKSKNDDLNRAFEIYPVTKDDK